jgi:hypothetical protein
MESVSSGTESVSSDTESVSSDMASVSSGTESVSSDTESVSSDAASASIERTVFMATMRYRWQLVGETAPSFRPGGPGFVAPDGSLSMNSVGCVVFQATAEHFDHSAGPGGFPPRARRRSRDVVQRGVDCYTVIARSGRHRVRGKDNVHLIIGSTIQHVDELFSARVSGRRAPRQPRRRWPERSSS